jgi:hypothetical protein
MLARTELLEPAWIGVDGNEAAARVAYATGDFCPWQPTHHVTETDGVPDRPSRGRGWFRRVE